MPRYRVLLTDRAWPDAEVEREILASADAELIEAPQTDEATLVALAQDCDAIATCWAEVTDAVVRAAPRCRVIARLGIGLDNIAVATATELGIPVTNVPDYCVDEVAEHTLALILACSRRIAVFDARAKRGEYDRLVEPPLRRLAGQALGLVGFGRIGEAVFHRAKALGLNVMAHTRSGNNRGTDCTMVGLPQLLEQSDYVSLHAPLTEQTRGLIAAAEFDRMKSTAYLVNTSRGGLVDHQALWSAVRDGVIAGAALDVFDPEPPDLTQPLYRHERVLVTPHAAFLSAESLQNLRERAAAQVADVLQNRRPEHVANPEVLESSDGAGPLPD